MRNLLQILTVGLALSILSENFSAGSSDLESKTSEINSAHEPKERTDYFEIAGSKFKNNVNFLDKDSAKKVKRKDLAKTLSLRSNEDEFIVAYFPKDEIIVNLTKKREITRSLLDKKKLYTFLNSGKRFTLIHNHNNRKLNPDAKKKGRDLYWIAPSVEDLGQYIAIGKRIDYGIITNHGLLTISTSQETFKMKHNPYFYKALKSEAFHLQHSLEGVKPDQLENWAKNYRGIFGLKFEGVSKR